MVGAMENNQDTPFGFKRPEEPILSLGVFFSHNQTDADELNFGAKIRDSENSLHTWKRRKLTLYGKINIVKTLGLSKLIFNASVLYIPQHYIEQINKITFRNFIWDGKPAKIKRKTLIGEKKWRAINVRFFYYGKSFENRLDQQGPKRIFCFVENYSKLSFATSWESCFLVKL